MRRREAPTLGRTASGFVAALALLLLQAAALPTVARADEEDDIQRQIDTQKSGVPDLEKLDTQKAAAADIQRLRDWLAQAWDLRNKHEPDEAREVLDRCLSQAELIRQIIAASQAKTQVAAQEATLKKTRDEIERKKKALQEAQAKKRAWDQAQGAS